MRIPIRMLSAITALFWIFLAAFTVSAIYSFKDVKFGLAAPQINVNGDGKAALSIPITVANDGLYNIGAFNISTEISDEKGNIITQNSSFVPIIRSRENVTIKHVMIINFKDLMDNGENYLFNDTELEIKTVVNLKVAEVIPVKASANISMPWGAPLHNFTIGKIEYTSFNSTHLKVKVPISFTNHAFFDVSGKIEIRMFSDAGVPLWDGQLHIEAQSGSIYNESIEFHVPVASITGRGYFEFYFVTTYFSFGPLVVPYG
ncbi:MAG: hypothetical protein QXZ25_06055 [Candidatus Bathyarchaeia archaeon]